MFSNFSGPTKATSEIPTYTISTANQIQSSYQSGVKCPGGNFPIINKGYGSLLKNLVPLQY